MGIGHGRVTRYDPPKLLEYTWDSETLRWELEPDGDTACRMVFTNIFDDRDSGAALGAGHLKVLREAGLVEVRRDAQRRWYRLRPEPLLEIDARLAPYRRFWDDRLEALGRHLDAMPDEEGD